MNIRAGRFQHRSDTFLAVLGTVFLLATIAAAQDVEGSKDPAGMKRYEGSELIGYRAPKFDEYLLRSELQPVWRRQSTPRVNK